MQGEDRNRVNERHYYERGCTQVLLLLIIVLKERIDDCIPWGVTVQSPQSI